MHFNSVKVFLIAFSILFKILSVLCDLNLNAFLSSLKHILKPCSTIFFGSVTLGDGRDDAWTDLLFFRNNILDVIGHGRLIHE